MRKLSIIYVIIVCSLLCSSSHITPVSPSIPIFFDTTGRSPDTILPITAAIIDPTVKDTLTVYFKAHICFKYSLKDSLKPIIVDSIQLSEIVISRKDKSTIIKLTSLDKKMKKSEQHIWDISNQNIQYWLRHQPYRKLYGIDEMVEGLGVYGYGFFYLIPKSDP